MSAPRIMSTPGQRPVFNVAPPAPEIQAPAEAPAAREKFGTPFFLFCIYTFIVIGRPQDYVPALIPLRLALVFTVLTGLATVFRRGSGGPSVLAVTETKLYLLFFASMVWTIPFSIYRPGSFDFVVLQYSAQVAYFLLFLVHVDSIAKFRRIAVVIVCAVCLFTVFGFRNGAFVDGRYTVGGNMYDPNDAAFVEVSLIGFVLWVLVDRFGFVMKAIALVSALMGVVLVLYTASRGGLLGLVTFLLLFLWLRVPKVKGSFKMLMCIGVVIAGLANADKINITRFMTLGSIENDYNFEEFGRKDIWERGLRLFMADPLTGVGVAGFGNAIGTMRKLENRLPKWQTAHNSYVLVLTETGLFGAVVFVLLIVTCVWTFNRLRRKGPIVHGDDLGVLPGLLLIGFAAQLVSATFLSQTYSMYFTLAFATSGAMSRLASGLQPAASTTDVQPAAASPARFAYSAR